MSSVRNKGISIHSLLGELPVQTKSCRPYQWQLELPLPDHSLPDLGTTAYTIDTLRGKIPIDSLGRVLVHEHVFCRVSPRYFELALDGLKKNLQRLHQEHNVRTIVDLTTYVLPDKFFDALLSVPINIVCCAGFYVLKRVPGRLRRLDHVGLSEHLLAKFTDGIGRRKVRPAIIKVASQSSRLSAFEINVMKAAAHVQQVVGAPIATHACRGGRSQLDQLLIAGADPKRIFLSHLEMELKGRHARRFSEVRDDILAILGEGAYVFFGDFPYRDSDYKRSLTRLVRSCIDIGYISQILISADAYWSIESGTFKFRGIAAGQASARDYGYVFRSIVPTLLQSGCSSSEIEKILVENPARFLSGRKLPSSTTPHVSG